MGSPLIDRIRAEIGFDRFRVADNERHPHGPIVSPALVLIVILTKPESLIARVDDHGVVIEPSSFR